MIVNQLECGLGRVEVDAAELTFFSAFAIRIRIRIRRIRIAQGYNPMVIVFLDGHRPRQTEYIYVISFY